MATEEKLTVNARVRVTLDITLSQPWDPKEQAETLMVRASREAKEIASTITGSGSSRIAFVGEPKVFMIVADKDGA